MRNPILWEWMNSCPNKSKMTSAQLLCFADVVHNRFHCYPLGLLLCYDKSLITFISHDVFIGHLLTLINATLYVCRLILALPTYLLSRGTQFELQHEYFCFQFLLHWLDTSVPVLDHCRSSDFSLGVHDFSSHSSFYGYLLGIFFLLWELSMALATAYFIWFSTISTPSLFPFPRMSL